MKRFAIGCLLLLSGCFLQDDTQFQGAWLADVTTPEGRHYRIRVDFSRIEESRFDADALLGATEPTGLGPTYPVEGRATGKVDGRDISVDIPITLLDGSSEDLAIRASRDAGDEGAWPVEITWRGTASSTTLVRPLRPRWPDTGLPGSD